MKGVRIWLVFFITVLTGWLIIRQLLRWQLIGAFDIVTELALFAMAVYLLMGLRMPFQLKAFVISAFAFRLP